MTILTLTQTITLLTQYFRVNWEIMKNVDVYFFSVEDHCIECSTCTDLAENCFKIDLNLNKAVVHKQPSNQEEFVRCLNAEKSCPVGAIQNES